MDGAKAGQYTVALVWAIDRLSRKGIEDTLATLRRLSDAGCAVWSRRESWTEDLKGPHMRELFISIAAWVAKMESDRRSERVRAGLARRRAEGKPVGRQPGAKDTKAGSAAAMSPAGKMAAHVARQRLRRARTVSHEVSLPAPQPWCARMSRLGLLFWPFAGFVGWPLLVWHGTVGWTLAAFWWVALAVVLAALSRSRR